MCILVFSPRHQDMSFNEPSVWLRTHSFVVDGVLVKRECGSPVGALAADWRLTRRKNKEMFYATIVFYMFGPLFKLSTAWKSSRRGPEAPYDFRVQLITCLDS